MVDQAVMSGENLPLVGKSLEYRKHETTARLAHVVDTHFIGTVVYVLQ